ncbi:lactonase family protein [Edaphobacter bradus]|uniref:lactonase family protein n=1 Tax=Edaphobacter bradus TaxID=2259016 RepID=UPI0021E07C78|nr:lactonase family protein [Edaphobacter bradus]
MLTRRRFLVTFPAFAAVMHDAAFPFRKKPPAPPAPVFVYFGTDTSKGVSKGIYQSRFDPASGHLTPPTLAAVTPRPSYLALAPISQSGRRFLYAVNETNDSSDAVTTFAMDPKTGALRQIGQVPSGGAGPCYVSVDSTGKSAFVANYSGGTLASYRIAPDGTLSQPVDRIDFHASKFGKRGPNAARQDGPHVHSATISPDNRFLLASDLGSDDIAVFSIDPRTAQLATSDPYLFRNNRPGSGTRHVAFHPNCRWVYGICELDSTIDHYLWSTTQSTDTPKGLLVNANFHISTVAPDFTGKNTGSEVAVSPDGSFLYASNRGEDTLVVFAIRPKDGSLSVVQRIACGGKTPRHFVMDQTGRWILCGNQNSATVTVFRRDPGSGQLTGPVQTVNVDSPMFSLFA